MGYLSSFDEDKAMTRAAANVLLDFGYTRDNSIDSLDPEALMLAADAVLKAANPSTKLEFLTESQNPDSVFDVISRILREKSVDSSGESGALCDSVTNYAEPWIINGIDLLPSVSDIEDDRKVEAQVEARKEAI